MELKPGYKQTEVGVIPEDWGVRTVAEMGDVLAGKALAARRAGRQRPYLRTKNVYDGRIDVSDVLTMPMTDDEFAQFMIRPFDLLLNEGQSLELVGRCAMYMGEYPEPCAMQNQLLRFRARQGVSAAFACHLFRRCQQTGVFARVALKTTSIAHLGGTRFEQLKLAWPGTEDEQNAIAIALSDADALLNELDWLIAKKRDLKQASMQQLLTGRSRLPGFDGEWETKRIGDIATPKAERNATTASLPVLTCSKHLGFLDSLEFFKNQVFSHDLSTYKVIRRGEIGYPANHVEEGSIGLQDLHDVALVSPIYVVFAVNNETDSFFLHRLLKLDTYRQKFRTATAASVDRRGSLRWPAFSAIEVRLPPTIAEQQAVAAVLSDMDAEIEALEQRRAKTADLKQAMMQEMLTGRIRIKGIPVMLPVAEKTVAEAAPGATSPKKPHNWQINEAVIIGVLAGQFGSRAWPLPRKRRVKLTYLLHRHCEGRAEGYLKKAAGPYDPRTKYQGPEKIAVQNKYVAAHHNGKYEGFIGGLNIDQAVRYFEKWYGAEPLEWIEQFHYEKTDELELLATVDMAMVELASKQQATDVEGVKSVILEHPEWEAKLEREIFSDMNIARAIDRCAKLFGQDRGSHA